MRHRSSLIKAHLASQFCYKIIKSILDCSKSKDINTMKDELKEYFHVKDILIKDMESILNSESTNDNIIPNKYIKQNLDQILEKGELHEISTISTREKFLIHISTTMLSNKLYFIIFIEQTPSLLDITEKIYLRSGINLFKLVLIKNHLNNSE